MRGYNMKIFRTDQKLLADFRETIHSENTHASRMSCEILRLEANGNFIFSSMCFSSSYQRVTGIRVSMEGLALKISCLVE